MTSPNGLYQIKVTCETCGQSEQKWWTEPGDQKTFLCPNCTPGVTWKS